MKINEEETPKKNLNFIEAIVDQDVKEGKNGGRVQTRFPPEPNGYLHIGHAKAICLNFDIAKRYGGICNLRFDDTNPVKEDVEYVDSIMEDIQWLGYQWKNVYYASDYFQKLWDLAVLFIKKGLAYVDEQSAETIAKQKGTPTVPGIESPYRNRPIEENLALFQKMTNGEIPEGGMVLRAKIDMASPNMHFRDPIMYRIITSHPHHRTGWQWKVYPMYDFAHGQCDYFEGVTHSLCTLEFEVHRPLYDWFIDQYQDTDYRPRQIEFNRLNLTYTVMSKRKLLQLVQEKFVSGWDDPRMPTLCGLRRRGFTPESIHNFIDKIGYTKFEALNDIGLLEHAARESLNKTAMRVNAVLHPVKLIVTNYPEGKVEMMTTQNNPEDPEAGTREVVFSRELFIERDDFMENPPKNYFRLMPGQEVRLKSAYIVKCTGCKKDENGVVTEVYCEYDPMTKSGMPESNRKVKGTLHWVSAAHCVEAEVRLYDRLFNVENPSADERDFRELLNPDSLQILTGCKLENSLKDAKPLEHFQFQRIGYFTVDLDSTPDKLIFNRTVSLKDSWSKELNK
ncbi:MAG TPA: glutamine--tRNA ligase/YqeY domain fusion protein [Paludibacteraceae bacterium]|nr:glutamine--tRNA ligase/YqeY domain fusion protein [Paludibacteraceae bacterium]HRS23805.1 glutamine--tRNA ligase/YqeY domain fusion protein [Paludibacteraceae bacterium]